MLIFLFCFRRRLPASTLFPYTTLFRSRGPNRAPEFVRPSGSRSDRERSAVGDGRHGGRRHALGQRRGPRVRRSEEHTSELQSQSNLVCRLLLEKKIFSRVFLLVSISTM